MQPTATQLELAEELESGRSVALLRRVGRALRLVVRRPSGAIGLGILVVFTVVAFIAPELAPQDPNAPSSFSSAILSGPSWHHWLGTDENGRDVWSELLLGTQTTMLVGFAAALVSTVIGTAAGVLSGYVGGWTDRVIGLLDDWFLVLPLVPVTVLAATLLGERASSLPLGQTLVLIIVIGLFGWAGTSRIVRAEVLSLKQRTFIERSRALGASNWRIISRDIVPNVAPLVLANAVIYVSLAILTESTLSYLGLGDPNRFSWGRMLDNAQAAGAMTSGAYAYFLPPGICITVAVLGFSLVGNSIEPLFDPRLRQRAP
jgi:peptide/nickel transport system permease protein